MTSPALESRLRRAMGQAGDGDSTAESDTRLEAAWAQVQERFQQSAAPERSGWTEHHRRLSAVAAAVVALAGGGWLLTRLRVGDSGDGAFTTPAGRPVDLPTAPPSWIGPAAIVVALIVMLVVARRYQRPLVSTGLSLLAFGATAGLLLIMPFLQTAETMAATAPAIRGYELQSAEISYWPDDFTHTLVELSYVATEESGAGTVEALAAELDMIYSPPSRSGYLQVPRCLQRPVEGQPAEGFPYGDVFCLDSFRDGDLVVTGHRYTELGLVLPRLVVYSSALFGLVFLAVAASGDWFGAGTRRPGRGWMALALCGLAAATGLLAVTAYDVIRVGRLGGVPTGCRPGGDLSIMECRDIVYPDLVRRGVIRSGLRLYQPLILASNAMAIVMVALGWVAGLAGGLNRRRGLVLLALTALVAALGLGVQLPYAETISLLGHLND